MAVITFTPSSLQLVPNETVTVEWQSDTGLALVWQTSADESVATVAPLQNQGTSGTFSVTGVANGSTTIDINGTTTDMQMITSAPLPVTVGTVEDESYLNKRGLTHFWENIDEIKQDKLTAGAGISITGNTISATGGGTADSVAWGHITGSMSNQTDLTTALAAKANSADLATVATSGSYNDLSNKPTIPAKQVFYGTCDSSGGSSSKAVACSGFTYAEGNVIYVTFSNADTYSGDSGMIMNVNSTGAKVIFTQTTSGGGVQSDHKWAAGETVCFVCHNDRYLMVEAAMATTTTSGLMSVDDKNKLDGIAAGAEVNVQANWTESDSSSDAYIQNKPSLATVATSGSYNDLTNKPTVPEIKKRTGAATTTNITPLYVAGDGTTTTPMALKTHGDTRNGSFAYININEPTNAITEAYAGGYVWDEDEDWWRKMSEVRLALYSDIPTVPTVNNATLTIQKNGTTVNTFTANASSNVTANITVPTATSDLTNDSGFIDEVSTITNARIDEIMGVA